MDSAAVRLAPLLDQLVNYERTRPDRRLWDLAAMERLLQHSDARPPVRPAVQIGGSKGKGTTAGFLAAMAQAAGRRAGLYTSPHLHSLRERIQCDGQLIATEELAVLLQSVLRRCPAAERPPTFFEAMTAAAAEHFAAQCCELAIYEVGLGGRHDATTALPVDLGIVTMIELEHTDVLGDTEALIAREKAPVLRPGKPGYTAASGEGLQVLRAHAARQQVALHEFGQQFGCRDLRQQGDALQATLWLPDGRELPLSLPGGALFELPAVALAAAALAELLPALPLPLWPVPRPVLPCRFELRRDRDGEALVFDGAHTERSLAVVAAELSRRWPTRPATVLFGCATGKRWREGLSQLLPVADSFLVTALTGTASEDPTAIADWLARQGARVQLVPDAIAGLQQLRASNGPRLVTGSFYLAAAAREQWLAAEETS